MGMNPAGLMDHLLDVDPYDQPPTSDTKDETLPLPIGKDTEEEESIGGKQAYGWR